MRILLLFFLCLVAVPFSAFGLEFYSGVPFYAADKTSVTLEHFVGKPIVLLAWKDRCAMCRVMLPQIEFLQNLYPDIQFIPLMIDNPSLVKARKIYASAEIRHLPIYLDTEGEFTKSAGILSTPLVVIYDKNGDTILRAKGFLSLSSPEIKSKLTSLLQTDKKGKK